MVLKKYLEILKIENKYYKNLKVYRDLINSFNTARKEGLKKG